MRVVPPERHHAREIGIHLSLLEQAGQTQLILDRESERRPSGVLALNRAMSANVQTIRFVYTEKYTPDFDAAARHRIERFDCQDADLVYDVRSDRYPVRALGYCPLQDLWFSVFQGTICILSLLEGISSKSALADST